MTRQCVCLAALLISAAAFATPAEAQGPPKSPIDALVEELHALRTERAQLRDEVQPRRFYLTLDNSFNGAHALQACTTGFHMASVWEISVTSSLRYDTTLGKTRADSGEGPPSDTYGWVRTGYDSNQQSVAGGGNCNA